MRLVKIKYVVFLAMIFNLNIFSQELQITNYSFTKNYSTQSNSSGYNIQTSIGRSIVGISHSFKQSIQSNPFLKNFRNENINPDVDEITGLPIDFSLYQNYPNPFNPSTVIQFSIPEESFVNLTIYNLLGEKVAVLVDELKSPGNFNISWQAGKLSSGIYVYTLHSGDFFESKKLILLK